MEIKEECKVFCVELVLGSIVVQIGTNILMRHMGNVFIVIICFLGFDVINFEINLSFLNKWFSYITKKIGTKT